MEAAENQASSEELARTKTTTVAELEALRGILVGPEQRELELLRAELAAKKTTAAEIGRVLPDAILMRAEQDGRLAAALRPAIEGSIEGSVRRNPRVLADAVFPLMGPAIRRSIRQTLASFLEGLNRSLEYSISFRGLRWRLEAMRTGKPFSEVVLKYSLVFRVEQVFLIHRETALLLEHVTSPSVHSSDPDMVSGMLGAIQDFMSDSFEGGDDQRIEHIEFGDLVLEIAQGPQAILACVVRGLPRTSLRARMDEVLEAVHEERGDELRNFDGAVGPFIATRPLLETCFMEQRAESKPIFLRPGTIAVALSILVLTSLGAVWLVRTFHQGSVWGNLVQEIAAEPGIVLLSSGDEGSRYQVAGLKDPLARDPEDLAAAAGFDPERIDFRWEPYYSVAPHFVQLRAEELLAPPEGVLVQFRDGVLHVEGSADHDWVSRARVLVGALPGTPQAAFDVVDLDLESARSLARKLERRAPSFAAGSAELNESGDEATGLVEELHSLLAAAERTGSSLAIAVTGFRAADESAPLDRSRAEALQALLERAGEGRVWVQASGGGPQGRTASLSVRLLQDRARATEDR